MSAKAHQLVNKAGHVTEREEPWIFRTYAGHSSPRASNELYRQNLTTGQTGLSIAFDLPTQCGYSSDHSLARPEVGKVGVPINSLDDFHVLFDQIPLDRMNTSMTINGTSMWLLALYVALARERGTDEKLLRGTTQNDIVKEYLARGTYIFPPDASLRIIAEMYEWCLERVPNWNASNICSYHLQEAGATPAQELSFALVNAIGTLLLVDEVTMFAGSVSTGPTVSVPTFTFCVDPTTWPKASATLTDTTPGTMDGYAGNVQSNPLPVTFVVTPIALITPFAVGMLE